MGRNSHIEGPLVYEEIHILRGPWYVKKFTYSLKIILLIVNPSANLLDCFEVLLHKRMNNYLPSYFEAMQLYCIVYLGPVLRQFCRLRTCISRLGPKSTFSFLLIVFFLHAIQFTTWDPYAPTQYLFVDSAGTRTLTLRASTLR